jgi:hypothetical protein
MKALITLLFAICFMNGFAQDSTSPEQLKFIRQGVKRMIFDEDQSIPLASLIPGNLHLYLSGFARSGRAGYGPPSLE